MRFLRIVLAFAVVAGAGHAGADVHLAGSSTLLPIVKDAAPQFMESTGIHVSVRGGGSDIGVRAATNRSVDIGMVSRALSGDEARALKAYPIGLDGIAVIVNARNPLAAVTRGQVRDLFKGRTGRWHELGLADSLGATIPVVKAPGRSTRMLFDEHFGIGALLPPRAVELGSNLAILLYVSVDPQAVGYVSIGALEEAKRRGLKVKGIALDGVEPSIENCVARRYALCRPLNLVTRGTPRADARRFLDYLTGPAGRALVEQHGFAPLPERAP